MVRVAFLGLTDVQSSFPAHSRYGTVDKATNNKIPFAMLGGEIILSVGIYLILICL